MTKAPLLVTEVVQQRLTLAGRFANSVGVLSDAEVLFLLQNENHPEVPDLVRIASHLGRDQRIALKESARTDSSLITIPSELARREEKFWKTEYDITADFAGLLIPRQPIGCKARLCVMHEKVAQSAEFFFLSDKTAYNGKVWRFTGDKSLDDCEMTHEHTGTFGFWVADEQEAPDGCLGKETSSPINLHTSAVRELGWTTETVPMRQLHGRVHFRQYGVPLDQTVITFCADSGLPGGGVPGVGFCRGDGTVYVGCHDVRGAGGDVRFRRAVVPSNLKPFPLLR